MNSTTRGTVAEPDEQCPDQMNSADPDLMNSARPGPYELYRTWTVGLTDGLDPTRLLTKLDPIDSTRSDSLTRPN